MNKNMPALETRKLWGVHRMVDGETKDKKHEKEVTVKWRTHNSYVSRSNV